MGADLAGSARDRVRGPALGLIAVGVLGAIAYLLSFAVEPVMASILRSMELPEQDVHRVLESLHPLGWAFDIAQVVVGVLGASFVGYAGFQMLHLRRRTLVTVASALAMVPFCTSCCCLLGIPIGIWSLVVLSKPEVKAAFTS